MVNFSTQLDDTMALFDRNKKADEEEEDEAPRDPREDSVETPVVALRRVCDILRSASEANLDPSELHELVQRAAKFENEVVDWAYSDADLGFDFFPIYSGNKVSNEEGPLSGNRSVWCLLATPECLTWEI